MMLAVGCSKKPAREVQTEGDDSTTNEVGREVNSATDQAAAEDISAEAIFSSQEPIDQYVVISTLVQISAALDYWNGGMDKMFVIEYDRQNHVVQDKYGNRLHVSILSGRILCVLFMIVCRPLNLRDW